MNRDLITTVAAAALSSAGVSWMRQAFLLRRDIKHRGAETDHIIVDSATDAVGMLREALTDARNRIADQARQIIQLTDRVAEQAAGLVRRDGVIAKQAGRISELDDELASCKRHIDALERRINALDGKDATD